MVRNSAAARSASENNGMILSRGGRRARGFARACSLCRERNRGTSCAAVFCSCAWERDSCSVLQDKWGDPLWWWNCYLGHVVILCDLAFQTMFCFDGYKVILFYGTVWGAYGKLRKYFCSFGNALRGRMQLKHGNYFGFRWNSNVTWLVRGNLSQRAWRLPLL